MKTVHALLLASSVILEDAAAQNSCTYDQIQTSEGGCYTCPAGTKPDITGQQCNSTDGSTNTNTNWVDPNANTNWNNNMNMDNGSNWNGSNYVDQNAGSNWNGSNYVDSNANSNWNGNNYVDPNAGSNWNGSNYVDQTNTWNDPNANTNWNNGMNMDANNINIGGSTWDNNSQNTAWEGDYWNQVSTWVDSTVNYVNNWVDTSANYDLGNNGCNDIQINNNGICQLCPPFTRAQPGNICGPDTCTNGQNPDVAGQCGDSYSQPNYIAPYDSTNVFGTGCNTIQITSADGSGCQTCPPYTRAQQNGTVCAANTCSANSIVDVAGECDECGVGYIPDSQMRRCILGGDVLPEGPSVECHEQQMISSDGRSCIQCPAYTRAQNDNSMCAADTCDENSIITEDGTCKECDFESGYGPDATMRVCASRLPQEPEWESPCPEDRQIMSDDGENCFTCPASTRPQNKGTVCAADICISNQVTTNLGTCADCPEGQMPDEDNQGVCKDIPITCSSRREIFNEDRTGCLDCDLYTSANEDNTECVAEECWYDTQILTVQGTCEKCPSGYVSDNKGRECVEFVSNSICQGDRQVVSNSGNECNECWPFTRAQQDHTICRADRCQDDEIIVFDGTCEVCPGGTLPNSWAKECIPTAEAIAEAAEEEETASPTSLVAIHSMVEPASSEEVEEAQSKNALYLIIASGVGIFTLIGVMGIVYYNKIRNQKGSQQQEPATTEMSNMQVAKEQSVSEEPMNKELKV